MSEKDQVFGPEGCGGDAAAYVLGALDPAEAKAFERHLQDCGSCSKDLAGFEHVVDALAMSAPQYEAPAGLRARVMSDVRPEPSRSAASRRPWRGASRSWPPRAALATAMAAGLASAVFAIATLLPGGSNGVRVINASVVDSPGSAQMRLAHGRAEMIVRDLPAPAVGDIYEVWLKRPGHALEPTSALFSVSARGAGDIGVPGALQGVAQILVTEEPAGGSTVPTHRAVIVARLS